MTVIAWDGKTLAADKQSTSCGMARTTTKIHRLHDGLIALTGGGGHGFALLNWFKGERDLANWPRVQSPDDEGSVIHFTKDGVFVYGGNGSGHGEPLEDKFLAFGCGRDYAMAAMFLGHSAEKAVDVACHFDTNCGMGIDTLTLD